MKIGFRLFIIFSNISKLETIFSKIFFVNLTLSHFIVVDIYLIILMQRFIITKIKL